MTTDQDDEAPVFFIDRPLGQRVVAAALRDAGATVVVHDEVFPMDAPDTDWLGRAGAKGWLVLTKDKMIRRRPLERMQLRDAGVGAFIWSTPRSMTGPEVAACLVGALPRMIRFAEKTPRPFVAGVYASGVVKKLTLW